MVDDFSESKAVYDLMDEFKAEVKDKIHIIYTDRNCGAGAARNKGVAYAHEIGAPFILFNDSDDISDPRRLALVRREFEKDNAVNVVYTSFDIIDENGNPTPLDKVTPPVREIIEDHAVEPVEGEYAWIQIATKKKYTNLTSCTAARTSLAVEEPFPCTSVSEDCHTWLRYGAHPGKFVFIHEIKGHYRICTGTGSRSRSQHADFYEQMFQTESDGFEEAMKRAKKFGTMNGCDENDLRAAFYVRLALNLLHGGTLDFAEKVLKMAWAISQEKALEDIDRLHCEDEAKAKLKAMLK